MLLYRLAVFLAVLMIVNFSSGITLALFIRAEQHPLPVFRYIASTLLSASCWFLMALHVKKASQRPVESVDLLCIHLICFQYTRILFPSVCVVFSSPTGHPVTTDYYSLCAVGKTDSTVLLLHVNHNNLIIHLCIFHIHFLAWRKNGLSEHSVKGLSYSKLLMYTQ